VRESSTLPPFSILPPSPLLKLRENAFVSFILVMSAALGAKAKLNGGKMGVVWNETKVSKRRRRREEEEGGGENP